MLCSKSKRELINSALLGLVFMVLYSAFYTLSNLEKLILHSINEENPDFSEDAFLTLSVLYITFALFIWFVSPVISCVGVKGTITIGAVGFSLFIALFLPENGWLLYVGSICNGIGAAMLWTTQGVYIILNSTEETITRNTAIFASICHSSMLYGNIFVYINFQGKEVLDKETRSHVITDLLYLTIAGVVVASFLPKPTHADERTVTLGNPIQAVQQSWDIAKTKHMIILCPLFLYCGLQLSFLSGIFGAAVGFTTYFDGVSSTQLVPVTGFFTGVGEVLAGFFLVFMNPLLPKRPWLRSTIVFLGIISNCAAFLLCFLSYSNDSIFAPTHKSTIIYSRSWVAVIIGVLLGFSDGIFFPMLISLVGKIYPNNSASAMTIHMFCFSCASAVSFFYSAFLGLHWQLLILAVEGILGATCYSYVNHYIFKKI